MKGIWRHIVNVLFGAILVSVLTAAYILGSSSRKDICCKGITIAITDSTTNRFITPAEIRKILDKEYAGYIGMPVDQIDLTEIERILDSKSAILKSQAYTTKDSLLNIKVTQRKPIVRFQKGRRGFYADREGFIFPLQNTYASHVIIVDGAIPLNMDNGYLGKPESGKDRKWIEDMVGLVNHIEGSRHWKNKIVQIHVAADGDLTLIPREGNERFLFGQPKDIMEKFERIGLYYKSILKDKGAGYYSTIDVRYEGQLVCR